MKFDPYAFLAEHGGASTPRATCAIRAIPEGPNSTNSTNSTPSAPEPAHGPAPSLPKAERQADPVCPYGYAVNGNPRTWTGRIVSLDEWRRLTEWERHGSTGKLWNALTRQWEARNADQ